MEGEKKNQAACGNVVGAYSAVHHTKGKQW